MSDNHDNAARREIKRYYDALRAPNIVSLVKPNVERLENFNFDISDIIIAVAYLTWFPWVQFWKGLPITEVVDPRDVHIFCQLVCRSLRKKTTEVGYFRLTKKWASRFGGKPGSYCVVEIEPSRQFRGTVVVRTWHLTGTSVLPAKKDRFVRIAARSVKAVILCIVLFSLFLVIGANPTGALTCAITLTLTIMKLASKIDALEHDAVEASIELNHDSSDVRSSSAPPRKPPSHDDQSHAA